MAANDLMVTDNKLTKVSKVGDLQRDQNTGEITGFDINSPASRRNPHGTILHIDLSAYARPGQNGVLANSLREQVYDTYKLMVENVPAATPMLEKTANLYPQGVVWQAAGARGLSVTTPLGSDRVAQPIVMVGNLKLPTGSDPIMSAGGALNTDTQVQHYLGKDREWHSQSTLAALFHEHVHPLEGKGFQDLRSDADLKIQMAQTARELGEVPAQNRAIAIRIKNETVAIEHTNQAIMIPVGDIARDPTAYFKIRAAGDVSDVPPRPRYTELDLIRLRNGPVPQPLINEGYAIPEVIQMRGKMPANLSQFSEPESLTAEQRTNILMARIEENVIHHHNGLKLAIKSHEA